MSQQRAGQKQGSHENVSEKNILANNFSQMLLGYLWILLNSFLYTFKNLTFKEIQFLPNG